MMLPNDDADRAIRPPRPVQIERIARGWGLSPRQSRVLTQLALGHSNKEIAEALGCAEVTVEYHLSAIRRKTGLKGRAALISRFWIDAHAG